MSLVTFWPFGSCFDTVLGLIWAVITLGRLGLLSLWRQDLCVFSPVPCVSWGFLVWLWAQVLGLFLLISTHAPIDTRCWLVRGCFSAEQSSLGCTFPACAWSCVLCPSLSSGLPALLPPVAPPAVPLSALQPGDSPGGEWAHVGLPLTVSVAVLTALCHLRSLSVFSVFWLFEEGGSWLHQHVFQSSKGFLEADCVFCQVHCFSSLTAFSVLQGPW